MARRLRSGRAVLLALTLVGTAHADGAAPRREVSWRPEWSRFSTSDYALTGMILAAMAGYLVFATDEKPRWRTALPGEDGLRSALRLRDQTDRDRADAVSHRLYQGLVLYPYVVDVLGGALIGHRSPDVAGQMALLDTEALDLTGLFSYVSNQLFLGSGVAWTAAKERARGAGPPWPPWSEPGGRVPTRSARVVTGGPRGGEP